MSEQAETVELAFDGLAIDREAEVPIGVQLAWALRSRVGDGRFKPGQQLPGLRDLAEMIGVNVNTVRAVYQRLEQEGLLDSRQGSGTFVASTPPRPSAIATIAADAARAAHETGGEPREGAAAGGRGAVRLAGFAPGARQRRSRAATAAARADRDPRQDADRDGSQVPGRRARARGNSRCRRSEAAQPFRARASADQPRASPEHRAGRDRSAGD